MAKIKFFNHQKKIPCNFVPMILQTKVCVADITQKCRGHYIFKRLSLIVRVNVVLNKTVVDSD